MIDRNNILFNNPARSPLASQNKKWENEKVKQNNSIYKQQITSDKIKPRTLQCKRCGRLSSPLKLSQISHMIKTRELFCKACGCHDFEFFRQYLARKKEEGKYDYVLEDKKIIKKLPVPDEGI